MTTEPRALPDPPPDYPVVLDVAGGTCLVVGGGPVAARRADGLLAAGARVTVVVALERGCRRALDRAGRGVGSGRAGSLAGRLRVGLETCAPLPGRARPSGYHLVVTATGRPEVDRRGGRRRRRRRRARQQRRPHRAGHRVQLPAVHRDGPVIAGRLHRRRQPGAGPVAPRPGWPAASPPEPLAIAALLDEARTAVRQAGRPTDSVDWDGAISDRGAPGRGRPDRRGRGPVCLALRRPDPVTGRRECRGAAARIG